MKYQMDIKSNDDLFKIINTQDEYNQSYINETKEEMLRRGLDVQLTELENNHKNRQLDLLKMANVKIEEQNSSNKITRKILKWVFSVPLFIAIRPIMRTINLTPFERTKQLLALVLFLLILYLVITRYFFPIKKLKNKL